jgi:hypothetical protein
MFEDTAAHDVAERDVGVSSNAPWRTSPVRAARCRLRPASGSGLPLAVTYPIRKPLLPLPETLDGGTDTENRRAGPAGRWCARRLHLGRAGRPREAECARAHCGALSRAQAEQAGIERRGSERLDVPAWFHWSARIAVRSTLQLSTCGCALPVRLGGGASAAFRSQGWLVAIWSHTRSPPAVA